MQFSELKSHIKADLSRLYPNSQLFTYQKIVFLFHPRFLPILIIRMSSYFYSISLLKWLSFILVWLNCILFGIEVTPKCRIGKGLLIPHTNGVIIGAKYIGENVTIFQGVTIGAKFADFSFDPNSRPIIEENVIIGAGAKVLGGISLGSGSKVAPNSLVIESVPSNRLVMGVPAKLQE